MATRSSARNKRKTTAMEESQKQRNKRAKKTQPSVSTASTQATTSVDNNEKQLENLVERVTNAVLAKLKPATTEVVSETPINVLSEGGNIEVNKDTAAVQGSVAVVLNDLVNKQYNKIMYQKMFLCHPTYQLVWASQKR